MRCSIRVCLVASVDSEQALALLEVRRSSTSSVRLRAARFLAQGASSAHRSRLSRIRAAESNSWIRQALDQAIKRSEMGAPVTSVTAHEGQKETPLLDRRLYEELRAQAIEETSMLFLHELRPLIGFLDMAAAAEIQDYERSNTKASVSRVQSFLIAVERLRKASEAPAIQEFDLTDMVVRIAAVEAAQGRIAIDLWEEGKGQEADPSDDSEQAPKQLLVKLSLGRRDPVVTLGDPILIEMAVTNALRNAIEAVLEVLEVNRPEVILNWGVTDVDSWISVLDHGCGLPSGWDRLSKPGVSTKSKNEGHLGMGVPIAQRALESLRGSFQLTPRSGAGVACLIRWPREGIVE